MHKKIFHFLAVSNIYLANCMLPQEMLIMAIKHKDISLIQELIESKTVDLNSHDYISPLITAISEPRPDARTYAIIDLLLLSGANANYISALGQTPLLAAVQKGDIFIIEKLKKGGAIINPTRLLYDAIRYGHIDLFNLALSYGAKPHQESLAFAIGFVRPLHVEKLITKLQVALSDFRLAKDLYKNLEKAEDAESQNQALLLKAIGSSLLKRLEISENIGLISTRGMVGAYDLPPELAAYIGRFI
jgi:ankyrin repeat protein